jgi:hypothetical protein
MGVDSLPAKPASSRTDEAHSDGNPDGSDVHYKSDDVAQTAKFLGMVGLSTRDHVLLADSKARHILKKREEHLKTLRTGESISVGFANVLITLRRDEKASRRSVKSVKDKTPFLALTTSIWNPTSWPGHGAKT